MIPGDSPKKWSWVPNRYEIADTLIDEARYIELVRKAFRYMQHYDVYIAAAQEKEVVKVLERLLLYSLQPDDTKFPASEPRCEFTLCQQNEPWAGGVFGDQIRELSNKAMHATCEDARA